MSTSTAGHLSPSVRPSQHPVLTPPASNLGPAPGRAHHSKRRKTGPSEAARRLQPHVQCRQSTLPTSCPAGPSPIQPAQSPARGQPPTFLAMGFNHGHQCGQQRPTWAIQHRGPRTAITAGSRYIPGPLSQPAPPPGLRAQQLPAARPHRPHSPPIHTATSPLQGPRAEVAAVMGKPGSRGPTRPDRQTAPGRTPHSNKRHQASATLSTAQPLSSTAGPTGQTIPEGRPRRAAAPAEPRSTQSHHRSPEAVHGSCRGPAVRPNR
ncbi:hypothetical protein NDU88_007310 [Pleurodeles waltl]|uniref:Uncharacterized protein n=1 Tax=Pleurodeles waltl TaxID=8319 RepID=A0AAV7NVV1_PLEWA|nr:hypothetical protein NDU88_007310 [Pleurodeles waltl]